MARTMLEEFKSSYNFWAKAINTAYHATNRLYLRKGLNKTPYEIITGNKPNIKYFRTTPKRPSNDGRVFSYTNDPATRQW
jgi:hypothetical protein